MVVVKRKGEGKANESLLVRRRKERKGKANESPARRRKERRGKANERPQKARRNAGGHEKVAKGRRKVARSDKHHQTRTVDIQNYVSLFYKKF